MALDRRTFVATLAGAFAARGLAANASGSPAREPADERPPDRPEPKPGNAAPETLSWSDVRALFDLDPRFVHLASFFLVSHPRPVRAAIARARERLDANPLWIEEAFIDPGDEGRRLFGALARYLGAAPDEIALVQNTTTGLATLWNGLEIAPGQEILTTEHDHYAHHASIQLAAAKHGATVRYVALHDGQPAAPGVHADELVARLASAIGPKTRAVGVTWVHSSTGLKLPIAAMAEAVRAANAGRADADRCLLIVDGVHGLGVEDTPAATLGADFFVAGTHKWLFAPRGTGIVLGRADAWPHVRPTIPSFLDQDCWQASFEHRLPGPSRALSMSPGGFAAFEHLLAVADAIELHERIGRPRIAARIAELNGRFRAELGAMPGVTLYTPADPRLAAGIVSFDVLGRTPRDVVARLREQRILASESPYRVPTARVAAGIMVQPEEIERALRAIRALAPAPASGP